MSTAQSVSHATSDIATTFASDGERGLIIYALLLVIFLLLIFLFLMAHLVLRSFDRQAKGNEKMADAMSGVNATLSRVESAVGVQQMIRQLEKGELPRGALP